ncbi:MAG: UDP-N-acetylmuramate--L-alanine ligase [Saprospiraceae bacterium]|nr:UDP-N-acetylmuramate--L-alanine ligase [Saprospiraceae bacterium]
MNLSSLKKLYFLGIGGIGMSAIARFFLKNGVEIHGYDLTESRLTKKLVAEGMNIHYDINIEKIPRDIDGVIITPAIPQNHEELMWLNDNGYSITKRAEVLGIISEEKMTVAVAGTHGKTTTSSILSHILTYCGLDISAFLGGLLVKENSNFIHGNSDIVVLEADEFDRSFLKLSPQVLIILSVDPDHLDIYGDEKNLLKAYYDLTLKVKNGGRILLMGEFDHVFNKAWIEKMTSNDVEVLKLSNDFKFENVNVNSERYHFNFSNSNITIENVKSNLPGVHNISNTTAAIQVALSLGAKAECIRESIANFEGIKRRFEILHDGKCVLIDDYAHHPEEIMNAVKTVKTLYPKRNVLGIFQPHLFSRTNDFYKGFAKEISGLDEVWLLEIYPARELPIKGVDSAMIYNLIPMDNKKLLHSSQLIENLKKHDKLDVIITLGASDIDKYHEEIINIIK